MSSTHNTGYSLPRIALAATATVLAGVSAYAVYFDYKRRNDPAFRKALLKERKKLEKNVARANESGRQEMIESLRRAVALINSEPGPTDVEQREQYFMEQVALGEQLAARGADFFVASAISFYKALKVYPAPQELILIYQRTQPAAVFDLVMQMITIDVGGARSSTSSAAARAGAARTVDPRDSESQAILTPVEQAQTSRTTTTSDAELDNDSPSSQGSSYVNVPSSDGAAAPASSTTTTTTTASATGTSDEDPPEQVV